MLQTIWRNAKLVLVWALALSALSLVISLLWPRYYSATGQVLIISRDRSGIDPYTQAKAAERIGENLTQVMQTTDFYKKVMDSTAVSFDRGRWQNLDDRARRKLWTRDVQATMVYNTSLMQITAYSATPADALALASAVSQTLSSSGWEYTGGDVVIKSVNDPLPSRLPARPNFVLNVGLGFVLGGLLAGVWLSRYHRARLMNP